MVQLARSYAYFLPIPRMTCRDVASVIVATVAVDDFPFSLSLSCLIFLGLCVYHPPSPAHAFGFCLYLYTHTHLFYIYIYIYCVLYTLHAGIAAVRNAYVCIVCKNVVEYIYIYVFTRINYLDSYLYINVKLQIV